MSQLCEVFILQLQRPVDSYARPGVRKLPKAEIWSTSGMMRGACFALEEKHQPRVKMELEKRGDEDQNGAAREETGGF